jgi:hypothetical protein
VKDKINELAINSKKRKSENHLKEQMNLREATNLEITL